MNVFIGLLLMVIGKKGVNKIHLPFFFILE